MSDPRDDAPEPTFSPEQAGAEAEAGPTPEDHFPDTLGELDDLRRENADLRDRLLREIAEMDNLRKRTQREKADASRFAITGFARDLVTVADDLRRAVDAAPAVARENTGDPASNLLAGIELTERQLLQILERHGVRRFDPTGEKFNPAVHEAMFELPDPSKPAGTVGQVIEAGYMIGERVLRPARVGVARGGPKAPAPDPGAPGPEAAGPGAAGTDAPASDVPGGGGPAAGPNPEPAPETEPAPGEADSDVGGRIDKSA